MKITEIEDSMEVYGRRLKQAYAFPKREQPNGGSPLAAGPTDLAKDVGKRFRLKNSEDKQVYRVVGVQQDYKGELAYRAVPEGTDEQTGTLFPPKHVQFLTGTENIPFPTGE